MLSMFQYQAFNVGFGFPSLEYKPTWTSLSSGREPVYTLPSKLNNAMTHSLAMQSVIHKQIQTVVRHFFILAFFIDICKETASCQYTAAIASFPGHSHLQYLITCSIHTANTEGGNSILQVIKHRKWACLGMRLRPGLFYQQLVNRVVISLSKQLKRSLPC